MSKDISLGTQVPRDRADRLVAALAGQPGCEKPTTWTHASGCDLAGMGAVGAVGLAVLGAGERAAVGTAVGTGECAVVGAAVGVGGWAAEGMGVGRALGLAEGLITGTDEVASHMPATVPEEEASAALETASSEPSEDMDRPVQLSAGEPVIGEKLIPPSVDKYGPCPELKLDSAATVCPDAAIQPQLEELGAVLATRLGAAAVRSA